MAKKMLRKILLGLSLLVQGVFWFARDWLRYRALSRGDNRGEKMYAYPKIFDKDPRSHTFDKHYVYMDRWAFQELLRSRPTEHVDVGSSIRFLSMASTVTKLKFVDIRPVRTDFDNYECIEGSILQMPFPENSVSSLSCLHVAEHIGLGRYGDPLDVRGTEKACDELTRVLAPGGRLYFALPVGVQATYFNAHRVHDPQRILEYFKRMRLVGFSAVSDEGRFITDTKPENFRTSRYACGMFIFTK